MTKNELKSILEKHKLWLSNEDDGKRANLQEADLWGADLQGADLWGADLREANLQGADLREANLREADLQGADLREANLREADLQGADLQGANLQEANLRGANLQEANLREADLQGADLREAKNLDKVLNTIRASFYPLQCPEFGAYTAFKKARGLIVELLIPADAKRSSATSRKCRASKAVVVSITDKDGNPAGVQVESDHDNSFVYVVGETVEVSNFDNDRWNECAPGIHHYITRAEAVAHI